MTDYVMSVRAVRNGAFADAVGPTKFLAVPEGERIPLPSHGMNRVPWYNAVQSAGEWINDQGEPRGDILIVVHGYNMTEDDIMVRHRRLRDDLGLLGFKGTLVSFDWPCDDKALAYLPDRHNAKATALQLVSDGIVYLSKAQAPDCAINVHVLAHSTGAYVVREAFSDADDTKLQNGAWNVSQILFIAGDVSSASMDSSDKDAQSIYTHCMRLTNYFNRHDQVLDISNVKRVGIAPRAGRIGLPASVPGSAVNLDCIQYYEQFDVDPRDAHPTPIVGIKSHSWFFGDLVFTQDLFDTLIGIDRSVRNTRASTDGHLQLRRPAT